MNAIISLFSLNVLLSALSYCAGFLALKFGIASNHLNRISSLGTGIFIGSAFAVVIPEAFETLLSSKGNSYPFTFLIGLPILLGFMCMRLLDLFVQLYSASQSWLTTQNKQLLLHSLLSCNITLSLVLHSLCDGVALGVSHMKTDNSFRAKMFFMLMAHKIPTAFSLAVVLLKEGLSSPLCKVHLLIFSLSSFSSVPTYLISRILHLDTSFGLAILLLISAGTFLYSVIHVMKNSDAPSGSRRIESLQLTSFDITEEATDYYDPMLSITGMLIPLVFSLFEQD